MNFGPVLEFGHILRIFGFCDDFRETALVWTPKPERQLRRGRRIAAVMP